MQWIEVTKEEANAVKGCWASTFGNTLMDGTKVTVKAVKYAKVKFDNGEVSKTSQPVIELENGTVLTVKGLIFPRQNAKGEDVDHKGTLSPKLKELANKPAAEAMAELETLLVGKELTAIVVSISAEAENGRVYLRRVNDYNLPE